MKVYTDWVHEGEYIDEHFQPPADAIGFIYRIFHIGTGKMYIGKKNLSSTRKKKIGIRAQKKQLEELQDKRRVKRVQRITKESDWRDYNSSCKPLQELMKTNRHEYNKQIIEWCYSKKHLTYCEYKWMYHYKVLEIDSWNDNIAGTIFKQEIQKIINEKAK